MDNQKDLDALRKSIRGVRNLQVECEKHEITLHGNTNQFYFKQLAQEEVKKLNGYQVKNKIEVHYER